MSESSPGPALADEDAARAHCYALISRLFYAAPDADLLRALAGGLADGDAAQTDSAQAADEPGGYAAAFAALQYASRSADLAGLRQEYDDTFVGAGKALAIAEQG